MRSGGNLPYICLPLPEAMTTNNCFTWSGQWRHWAPNSAFPLVHFSLVQQDCESASTPPGVHKTNSHARYADAYSLILSNFHYLLIFGFSVHLWSNLNIRHLIWDERLYSGNSRKVLSLVIVLSPMMTK